MVYPRGMIERLEMNRREFLQGGLAAVLGLFVPKSPDTFETADQKIGQQLADIRRTIDDLAEWRRDSDERDNEILFGCEGGAMPSSEEQFFAPDALIYWIDAANGDDNNTGTSYDDAFLTIEAAIDRSEENSTLYILPARFADACDSFKRAYEREILYGHPTGTIKGILNPDDFNICDSDDFADEFRVAYERCSALIADNIGLDLISRPSFPHINCPESEFIEYKRQFREALKQALLHYAILDWYGDDTAVRQIINWPFLNSPVGLKMKQYKGTPLYLDGHDFFCKGETVVWCWNSDLIST